jgi:hypothetical protein
VSKDIPCQSPICVHKATRFVHDSMYKDLLFEALAALTPLACASDRLIGWRPLLDLSIAVLFIEFLGMSRHCQSIVRVLLVFKKTQPKPIELLSIDYIISGLDQLRCGETGR